MKASGSFKMPNWDFDKGDYVKKMSLRARNILRYIFWRAAHAYMKEVAELIPVLTGTMRKEAIYLLHEIEDEIITIVTSTPSRGLFILSADRAKVRLGPTARQHPFSPNYPMAPDPGRVYKSATTYRGVRIHSREEFRAAAMSFTSGEAYFAKSGTGTNQFQTVLSFDFRLLGNDVTDDYYPAVYQTVEAAKDVFGNALRQYFEEDLMGSLQMLTESYDTQIPFNFDFGDEGEE